MLAVTGMSLKKYLTQIGDTKTKHLHLAIPFSIREMPKTEEDFELRNDFAIMKHKLTLSEDFN